MKVTLNHTPFNHLHETTLLQPVPTQPVANYLDTHFANRHARGCSPSGWWGRVWAGRLTPTLNEPSTYEIRYRLEDNFGIDLPSHKSAIDHALIRYYIDLLLSRTRTVPSLNIYHDPSIPALSVVARILITLPYTHSQVPTTDTLAYNDRSLILMIFRWRWPLTNWIRRSF